MARVVVISFTDDAAAEQFCIQLHNIQEAEEPMLPEAYDLGAIAAAHGIVEALIAKPTLSCPHPFRNGTFKKTEVFGWYVHATKANGRPCFRPHPLVVQNFINNMLIASGNNLLPALLDKMRNGSTTSPVDPSNED